MMAPAPELGTAVAVILAVVWAAIAALSYHIHSR